MNTTIKQAILLFLVCAFVFASQNLSAQVHADHSVDPFHHPVLSAIQHEVVTGQLTKEEALLQSIYAGFKPERLEPRFRIGPGNLPMKCLTYVMAEYERSKMKFSSAVVSEIENLISPKTSASTRTYTSPSENFLFYYETEGPHAVPLEDLDNSGIPDYVEKAAFAADSSYRYEVTELGFTDFLKDDPYEIYFENFGFYGTTQSSGSTTLIRIHNNFAEGFPPNTHPESEQTGALYATIAHEVKHAIQYANSRWKGEAGSAAWIEMDATMMEEIVFDDVNDYYNYIMLYNQATQDWDRDAPRSESIFGSPNIPIPGLYNHVSWSLFFHEAYGPDFWVQVWEEIRKDYLVEGAGEELISILDAVNLVLQSYNDSFEQAHIMNHLWHMSAGPHLTTPQFGFREKSEYPSSRFKETLVHPPDSLTDQYLLARSANYIQVIPSNIIPGQPSFLIDSSVKGIGVGVIGFFKNGEIDVQFKVDPNSTNVSLQTIWSWENLADVRIAVVNTSRDSTGTYNLTVSSTIPEEDTITQNYPNPFNPITNIRFSLTEAKHVTVDVYDRIGRKVTTLLDEQRGRGFHTVQFDGTGMASGVYFYRIKTDQTVTTKKMVLVK